ncbi:uncharacterized protein LOC141588449 [Silene latifolia]|uniref:uncharacterized protein LOC141588449 n=1 Tax=Silene latifolia TaxID=37657 RepID=UPI003D786DEA
MDFVQKHWNHGALPVVQYFRKGWFNFKFDSEEAMNEVLKRGPWNIGSNSLVLKQWSPYFSIIMECVTTVFVWILFPDLDPYMWTDSILSKMSDKIGKPLFADLNTTCKAKLSFARVMIEVDVSKDLPDIITINAPYIGHSHQRIIYEWLPYYCHTCKKLGHTTSTCKRNKATSEGAPKKKGVSKTVYKLVVRPVATVQDQPVGNVASECHLSGGTSASKEVASLDLNVGGNSECSVLGSPSHEDFLDASSLEPVMHSGSSELGHPPAQVGSVEQLVAIEDPGDTILSPNKFSPLAATEEPVICSIPRTSENPSTTAVTILEEHDQVLHCSAKHLATGREFLLSIVYGNNNATARHRLWHSLRQFAGNVTPWVAMGDFNVIRYLHENISHNSHVQSELVDFNECLIQCGLDDMNGSSCEYTWYNKQDAQTRVYTKLDRVLVNDKWKELFANTSAQFMDPGVSDRSPALLRFHGDIRPSKRFKFLNCWVEHPDFHKIVAEAWSCDITGNSMFRLMGKLKAVKKKLKILHSTSFSNITERVKTKQAELAHCYQDLQSDPLSPILIQKEQAASADFWKLKRIEMSISSQRAKIHDVKHNDTSSRFFFQKIKER